MSVANPGAAKRAKERKRAEKRQVKADKKAQRRAEKDQRGAGGDDGVDPDIAGIVPGPQPVSSGEEGEPSEDGDDEEED